LLWLNITIAELRVEQDVNYWDSIVKEAVRINSIVLESKAYNDLGVILRKKGEILKALECYHRSLEIEEKVGNELGEGVSLNNLGVLYHNMGEDDKALKFYRRSLQIAEKYELPNLADRYWNMATWHADNNDSAIYYFRLAGDHYYKLGGDYGFGSYHYALGTVQMRNELHKISIDHFKKAAYHYKNINHLPYTSRSYAQIAENAIYIENYELAERYADSAMSLSLELESVIGIMQSSNALYHVYLQKGDYKNALEAFETHKAMEDSLKNIELVSESIKQNMSYEYEKEKAIRETEHQKEAELLAEKEKRQTVLIVAISFGLVLVIAFAFFILKRLRITKRQKSIIETQQQELTDSIAYAKRIQYAILPPMKEFNEHLKNGFVLYKPKDVVAGDFYWLENVGNKTLFAAADCTGHGVPGAMVSVVCNSALNRSVREHKLSDPGKILDKTREIVIQEFEKSEEEVKDGMDIALCSLEGMTLKYAGAHNPLWIIRNREIIETKANKQPIGKFDNPEPYTTHTFVLEKGDTFYLFSDGYVDQFGGEKGKKFKAKAFRELLLSIQDKSMEEQKKTIDEAFEVWRGDLEQIDDVCVIGVRV
jgi:serine phosphatase RsbU (regulator of sigma subunit)